MVLKEKLLQTGLFENNDYLDKYCDLIKVNLKKGFIKNKMQRHHIIPKSYYLYINKKIDNSINNLVNLLYKDHILAHYYLAKCTKIEELSNKNLLAIKFLIKGCTFKDFRIESIDLEEIQKSYVKTYKWLMGRSHSPEVNRKISITLTGRPSPIKGKQIVKKRKSELSKKLSNPKNKKLSDLAAARIGERNSFYGKHHTEDTKHRISMKNSKAVGMYKVGTDILIKEFYSLKAASNYLKEEQICLNTSSQSRISKVCKLNNKTSIAYGYNWRYINKV